METVSPAEAPSSSPVGNLADLKDDQVLLPAFITRRSGSVFVEYAKLGAGAFEQFVDRLFENGGRFAGLDYAVFIALLYPESVRGEPPAKLADVRIAGDIVRFAPERQALYKALKIFGDGEGAEYVFEPATIDVTVEEPVYSPPGEDGVARIIGSTPKIVSQPTKLDFDEFVAAVWGKGVRFGIDQAAVRQAIQGGISARLEIARQLDPLLGTDATVEEQTEALHRDDAPRLLPDGRVDLKQFKNRFPQIHKNAALLKKIPRVMGKPGYKVSGAVIEPPEPLDFELSSLAGPGTRVDDTPNGEFIVAAMDGFIILDTQTNLVSVTEKIVNRDGINMKTTGDLSLGVDNYEEYGEVQEGRVVEGKNMTFQADVFGHIISTGGHIQFNGNLAGGLAKNIGGSITVAGRATMSKLEAWDGKVKLNVSEGSLIIAREVEIERAVSCIIIADEVHIASAEGCAIAGKNIVLDSAGNRKDTETIVTVVVPDFSAFDQQLSTLKKDLAGIQAELDANTAASGELRSQQEFAGYLTLENRIRQGEIKLSAAQLDHWKKAQGRFAPQLGKLQNLTSVEKALQQKKAGIEQLMTHLQQRRRAIVANATCAIGQVEGDVLVRTLPSASGMLVFHGWPDNDIKTRLRDYGPMKERVFTGDSGNLEWRFKTPEPDA